MTTNSPYPVDGDVQALIADCQAEIAEIEKALTTWGDAWIPSLQSKLKRQQVALAALTTPGRKVFTCSGCGCENFDEPNESDCHCFVEGREWVGSMVYTTPPAQLFRPVELPGGFSPAIGDIFDRQAPVMRRDKAEGCWIHKAVVAELLRSLGHEVKE